MKIKIKETKKVKIEKGDMLIFELDADLSPPQFDQWCTGFTGVIKGMYPDVNVLVLPKQVKFKEVCHSKEGEIK